MKKIKNLDRIKQLLLIMHELKEKKNLLFKKLIY